MSSQPSHRPPCRSRIGLLAPLLLGVLGTPSSWAQDATQESPAAENDTPTEPRRLDEIVVTGTRIKRIEIEGPLPISVIERSELLQAGQPSLQDAIRDLPWNSFGSFADVPNSDAPNASLPQLRGLGSKYTLTLLDGQRLPGFANYQGGAAASLTGIPLAAIDRIEVLRDGASAIYGSDAIGGVINLVTRREDTPPQFDLQWEEPQQDGGGSHRASFVVGHGFPRGHLLLALETQEREPLLGAQRDFLIENAATSFSANPGSFRRIDPATGDFVGFFEPDPRCPERFDTDPVFPSSEVREVGPNRLCAFRFRDQNMERAGYDARSLFLDARHELAGSVEGFARVLGIDGAGRTQLAPTPAGGLRLGATNPNNPTLGERGPGLGYPVLLNYRLSALGPRVTTVEERTWHVLAGIEGTLDWSEGGDWQLAAFHNRYDADADGVSGYALRTEFQAALGSGRFDPFTAEPGNPVGLEDAIYRPYSRGRSRADGLALAFTLDTPFFAGLSLSHAFGLDLRRDRFALSTDAATQAGLVLGQGEAAPPEGARRDYGGVYGEWFLPFAERWELSFAARYDRYEDAGGRLSPKVALAFRPSPAWLLRGALGRGFQAPDLVSAYGGSSLGVALLVDPIECAARPQDPIACEERFIEVAFLPNPQLGNERARQASLGLMWQPSDAFELGLDYSRSRIEGQIGTIRGSDALAAEFDCTRGLRECDPQRDGEVLRDEFGNVARINLPYINIAGTRTDALDLEAGARGATRAGDFGLRLRATRVLRYDVQLLPTLPVLDTLGAIGRPRWRGELGLDWERGAHGASLGLSHIAGYGACNFVRSGDAPRNPECDVRVGSHTELDAQWRWRTPWRGQLSLGARNLRDRAPAFDPFGGYVYGLYDPNGRVWYLRYSHAF
jgi:iron complex outermembrane receptor protein